MVIHINMTTITFDTLQFTKRLKAAGFSEQQAETLAEEQSRLIEDRLASKDDFERLQLEIQRDLKELELRLTVKLGTLIAASIGITATLVKLL